MYPDLFNKLVGNNILEFIITCNNVDTLTFLANCKAPLKCMLSISVGKSLQVLCYSYASANDGYISLTECCT